MPLHWRTAIVLIAMGFPYFAVGPYSPSDSPPVTATAAIINQKYCAMEDELFWVSLTLRVKFENRSNEVLILDKEVGKFADEQIVAANLESLALRDYESNPIFDSFGYQDPPHLKPSLNLLRANYILLAPGKSFESNTTIEIPVWYVPTGDRTGTLNYGRHVLQLGFFNWRYDAKASQFAKAWRKFGQLVTEGIYTEPIDFQIPRNPQVEKTCN